MGNCFDKEFIKRYLKGECSEEEQCDFENWLNEPSNADGWMRELWNEPVNEKDSLLGARENILQNVLEDISNKNQYSKKKRSNRMADGFVGRSIWIRYPLLRYAAIITLILIPLFLFRTIHAEKKELLLVHHVSKGTHTGQHLTFRLEDGTKVTLNSNSSLIYPEQFSDSSRQVELHGEAFFDVAKDAKRPFSVTTGSLTTTALGTSFNIDYSDEDLLAEVSLLTGSVDVAMQLESGDVNAILIPGEQLVITENKKYLKRQFNPKAVTGWKDGIIYFEEAGINEIVNTLEEWYDVDISVSQSNKFDDSIPWTYSGVFKKQSLENVLIGIGYVKDFSFEIDDKEVNLMLN